jgi:acetoacetate decarboxylase
VSFPNHSTSASPLVRYEVMRMPDATGLGDSTESGQMLTVEHDGEAGEFVLAMYIDNAPAGAKFQRIRRNSASHASAN